jgi:hypothetical protein
MVRGLLVPAPPEAGLQYYRYVLPGPLGQYAKIDGILVQGKDC